MSAATAPRRVFIVDDHAIVREGLSQLINHWGDLVVCGESGDAREAMELVQRLEPDLAIVDISLKDVDGLDLIRQLRARLPQLPILVLSMHSEKLYAERVLRAGARGYIMKEDPKENVLTAIRCVLRGEVYLSSGMHQRLVEQLTRGPVEAGRATVEALSDRELEVFRLVGSGRSTGQVARELGLSAKTVQAHRENIKRKLNLESGAELVQHAVQWVEGNSLDER